MKLHNSIENFKVTDNRIANDISNERSYAYSPKEWGEKEWGSEVKGF